MQFEIKSGKFSQHSFSVFNEYSVSDKFCSFSIFEINSHEIAMDNSDCHINGHDFKHLKK